MTKCFADSSCESEMLHTIKGFDEAQGLVCLLDGHWGRVFDRSSSSGRHSLDDFYGYEYVSVESSSISELQPFSKPTKDVFSTSADAEWKWILYQQQASPCDLLNPTKSMDRYAPNMVVDPDNNVRGDVKQATAELSFASILCAASKVEACPHAGISKPQRVSMIQPLESNAAISSFKGSLSWETTNSKQFAAAIPHRGHAYTENCDLPPLTVIGKELAATISQKGHAHTESYDLPPLGSPLTGGEDCVANGCADLHDGQEVLLERKFTANIPSLRRGISDLTPSCELLSGVMEPSVIPTILQQPSVDDRSSYHFDDEKTMLKASNKKCFDAKKPKDEILGEALCHAQTRARLAEKLAAQALQERERLAHLLLREAWTTCTYKQRAQTLELENRLLKLCLNIDIEVWTGSESTYSMEHRARTSWKLAQKCRPCQDKRNLRVSSSRQEKDGDSSRSWKERVLLSCTLGLAFVLGLSIAGAGLMIGWSMGWILFS